VTGTLHVIGAGLAGLSCAVTAAHAGRHVVVYEATKSAGGRCRSFYDSVLGCVVDNGSHAVLGANPAVFEYLDLIGARQDLVDASPTGEIPFVDLETNLRWSFSPGKSRIPWWMLSANRRPPGTKPSDFFAGVRLLFTGTDKTVSEVIRPGTQAHRCFWDPFTTAVMNTAPKEASAALLGSALRHTLKAETGGLQAYVPKTNLAATFVEPALKFLSDRGAQIRFETPVRSISQKDRAATIILRTGEHTIDVDDRIVLAVPPWSPLLQQFVPAESTPKPSPIVNVHYKLENPVPLPAMTGVVGGAAHWIFGRDNIVSVTVSAAGALAGLRQDEIAKTFWEDVVSALNLSSRTQPPSRVIVERRATPVQNPTFTRSRVGARTHLKNVLLAGDWLDTGLPCTLESAVMSGKAAAQLALQHS